MTDLRKALAQPEQDGFAPYTGKDEASKIKHSLEPKPKREWVGLTDDEVWDAYEKGMYEEMWFARTIEAVLRSKNT